MASLWKDSSQSASPTLRCCRQELEDGDVEDDELEDGDVDDEEELVQYDLLVSEKYLFSLFPCINRVCNTREYSIQNCPKNTSLLTHLPDHLIGGCDPEGVFRLL